LYFDPYNVLPHGQGSEAGSDVAQRIRTIRSDPKHAYNVPTHADHQRAIEEMNALYGHLPLPEAGLSDELDVAL
jgi:hypothetical protein